jgi:hypothetical protein
MIILILGAVVSFVLATIFALLGMGGATEGGVASGLVGVSLTLLLAFFLGATSPDIRRAAPGRSMAS